MKYKKIKNLKRFLKFILKRINNKQKINNKRLWKIKILKYKIIPQYNKISTLYKLNKKIIFNKNLNSLILFKRLKNKIKNKMIYKNKIKIKMSQKNKD